ncbi:DUF4214 domain-containing protein [Motiliproteus sp. MSK22-1]|uniref:DUF4214 domain-containing protein n=1 Tax=Motiliproteus sp. MSK22-1 TaxID=1897630 RepID=UPI0009782D8C|nr:DUF4214 domain-containing protein [Motiliproteus sp. MSK22-1]OMH39277.1 hypothetical protein BGP75_04075 [Motiliproteus sp. MSK22-1]
MALNSSKLYLGNYYSEDIYSNYSDHYYFGLQGDDQLVARNIQITSELDDVTWMAGGNGSDTYKWDGSGSFFLMETGGVNDSYVDEYTGYNTGMKWSAEIDNTHLVLWDDYGNEMLYANYNDPSARIENFYLLTGDSYGREHFTHNEFVTAVKQSIGWLGSYSYEQFGFSSYDEQHFKSKVSDIIQTSSYYEQISMHREANRADVAEIGRLYKAAFDREPDIDGLNYWIDRWEDNMPLLDIATCFYQSNEFQEMYGNPSNWTYIDLLYENVLDRDPDIEGLNYWLDEMESGMHHAGVLASFSNSIENIENTEVIFSGLYDDGGGYWLF